MKLLRKLVTEKSAKQEQSKTYVFEVDMRASKNQIIVDFYTVYGTRPVVVRTAVRPGKIKRVGTARKPQKSPAYKIAYISLSKELPTLA